MADDRWLLHLSRTADRHWRELCNAIGRPDLLDDERFETSAHRSKNSQTLVEELDNAFAKRTLEQWRTAFSREQFAWDVVTKASELVSDEQSRANGLVQTVDYGTGTCRS